MNDDDAERLEELRLSDLTRVDAAIQQMLLHGFVTQKTFTEIWTRLHQESARQLEDCDAQERNRWSVFR